LLSKRSPSNKDAAIIYKTNVAENEGENNNLAKNGQFKDANPSKEGTGIDVSENSNT